MLTEYLHIKYQSRSPRDLASYDIYKVTKTRQDEQLKLSVLQELKKSKN